MVMFLFVTPLYFVLVSGHDRSPTPSRLIRQRQGFNLSASAFFRHLAFVFLAAYAAETQSILVASLLPLFIAALALSAFINGFWMTRELLYTRYCQRDLTAFHPCSVGILVGNVDCRMPEVC